MGRFPKIGVEQVVTNSQKFNKDMKKYDDTLIKSGKTTDKFSKETTEDFKKTEKASEGLGLSMKDLEKVIGVTFGIDLAINAIKELGRAYVQFIGESVEAASAVEEMSSKFEIVFGSSAKRATQQLDEFGDSVGRSTFKLQGMSSTIQDTLVPMGFARNAAADLSVEITKLAVDTGSFNDVSDEDVIRDFQSALVGNTETVRKYGIVITQTTLDAELLRQGIEGGVTAATEQEKIAGRLSLIMDGLSDAQGDALRTADGYANSAKALEDAMFDLKVVMGDEYLPLLAKGATLASDGVNKNVDLKKSVLLLSEALKDGSINYFQFLAIQSGLTLGLEKSKKAYDKLAFGTTIYFKERQKAAQADQEGTEDLEGLTEATEEQTLSIAELNIELRDQAHAAVETADTMSTLKAALDSGIISQFEYELATRQLKEGILVQTDAMSEQIRMQRLNEEAASNLAARQDELIESNRLAAAAARDHALAQFELGVSLKDASEAQIATTAIGLLKTEIEKTGDPTGELFIAMNDVAIAFGLADAQSQALSTSIPLWVQALSDSVIAGEDASESLGALITDSEDGTVAIEDITDAYGTFTDEVVTDKDIIIRSVRDTKTLVNLDLKSMEEKAFATEEAIVGLTGSFINLYQIAALYGSEVGSLPGGGSGGGADESTNEFASGVDMIVPAGFENDTFGPFFAQSGERLIVIPRGQVGNAATSLPISTPGEFMRQMSSSVTNNANRALTYNQTVITSSTADENIERFRIAQSLAAL